MRSVLELKNFQARDRRRWDLSKPAALGSCLSQAAGALHFLALPQVARGLKTSRVQVRLLFHHLLAVARGVRFFLDRGVVRSRRLLAVELGSRV